MDEIRTLTWDELDESFDLSCFAFQYELSPEERAHRPGTIWGYFVDGKLAAKMTVHPLKTYINGLTYDMGGVAGVATWPEYRRKGMVAKLLRTGLKAMKEEGRTISMLHPFSVPFYRKYGWELCIEYKTYEIETAKLPFPSHEEGRVERADGDWRLLNGIYDVYARQYNGMLVRDELWWRETVFKQKKGMAAVYFGDAGVPRGYVLYSVKNRVMEIGEMAFLDEGARRGLWKFISNHDSMVDKVTLKAPSDDRLPYLLPDPRIRQETYPYFMARIVDVQGFVERYPFVAGHAAAEWSVYVEDGCAEWNDAVFRVAVDREGKAKVSSGAAGEKHDLSCDIRTLTALMVGYARPSFLHACGLLKGDRSVVELLERLIPARQTYLTDYF